MRLQGSQELQDHRKPQGRDNLAIVTGCKPRSARPRAAGHAVSRFREVSGSLGGKASVPTSTKFQAPVASSTRSSSRRPAAASNSLASCVAIVRTAGGLPTRARTLRSQGRSPVATQSSVGYAAHAKQLSAQARIRRQPAAQRRPRLVPSKPLSQAPPRSSRRYMFPAPLSRAARTVNSRAPTLLMGTGNLVLQPGFRVAQNSRRSGGIQPTSHHAPVRAGSRIRPSSDQHDYTSSREDRCAS